jgi:hypothetical protein
MIPTKAFWVGILFYARAQIKAASRNRLAKTSCFTGRTGKQKRGCDGPPGSWRTWESKTVSEGTGWGYNLVISLEARQGISGDA